MSKHIHFEYMQKKEEKINKKQWYTDDLDDTINNHTKFQFNWVKT